MKLPISRFIIATVITGVCAMFSRPMEHRLSFFIAGLIINFLFVIFSWLLTQDEDNKK